jgi:hypothetical protein
MTYFDSNGQPLDFQGSPGVGTFRSGGDQGTPKPIKPPGSQINTTGLQMKAFTPTPVSTAPISSPGGGGGAAIDPNMIMSLKNIIQNRQYASPAQQAQSPAYQDPNLQVGPANPGIASPTTQAGTDSLNAASGINPAASTGANGIDAAGNAMPSDGGGGMGGGMASSGLGSAVGGMLSRAASQDQANAQQALAITSKGAQTGTQQPQPIMQEGVDLTQSQDQIS